MTITPPAKGKRQQISLQNVTGDDIRSAAEEGRNLFTFETQVDGAPLAYMGLYYFGARYYDADVGIWISTDPMEQYWNDYNYVGNNPVNKIDPTGTVGVDWVGIGVMVGTGVAGSAIGAHIAEENGYPWYTGAMIGFVSGAALGGSAYLYGPSTFVELASSPNVQEALWHVVPNTLNMYFVYRSIIEVGATINWNHFQEIYYTYHKPHGHYGNTRKIPSTSKYVIGYNRYYGRTASIITAAAHEPLHLNFRAKDIEYSQYEESTAHYKEYQFYKTYKDKLKLNLDLLLQEQYEYWKKLEEMETISEKLGKSFDKYDKFIDYYFNKKGWYQDINRYPQ